MTTLAEYRYLGADQEVRMGIANGLIEVSPWLRDLPFVQLAHNNISRYKMFTSLGGATVHEVGDTWTTVNPTWEYREAALAILGDNVDVDEFGDLASGPEQVWARVVEGKTMGVGQTFDKLAVYGRTTNTGVLADSKNFKGLLRLIAECETSSTTDLDGWLYTGNDSAANNPQVVFGVATTSVALSIAMLDALQTAVRPAPTHLIMSRLMERKLRSLAQASGNYLTHSKDNLGFPITRFGDQIVLIDDQIQDNLDDAGSSLVTSIADYDYEQAISAANDISPIFAVRMAEDGLCGISGEGMIQVKNLGILESKDATGKRIKFYCGLRLVNKRAAAVLLNCNYVS